MASNPMRKPTGIALKTQSFITYQRGNMTVKDRKGLEGYAGNSCRVREAEYRRLLG